MRALFSCPQRTIQRPLRRLEASMLDVGQPAPDFTLKNQDNQEVSLSQFKGDQYVVLHTFPAAFTGG